MMITASISSLPVPIGTSTFLGCHSSDRYSPWVASQDIWTCASLHVSYPACMSCTVARQHAQTADYGHDMVDLILPQQEFEF